MSDKPPFDQNPNATQVRVQRPASEQATRVAADRPQDSHPQDAEPHSRANAARISSAKTQFTRYNVSHSHSTGFTRAQEIARQVLDNSGQLLKKRFVLEEVLGHGGMGTVYKASDLRKIEAEDPNPYIAIKVLNQDFKDHPDAFVTLQQEAAKSHTLAHPNIVTVHDFDRDGDTLYMTMELLEGEPLDQLLKSHPQGLKKPQVLRIVRDLCAALSYAHQRQIIHADFKPGNVFVMKDGSAKVLDFGIARAASKESQKHKFDAGQLGALTPAYASIEMVEDKPLTFTDDVYALACVIYEVFSGKHPYANRSAYTARQQQLKPKRIECLNSREWRALSHALALEKKSRTATIKDFVSEFFPRRSSFALKLTAGVAALALIGAGWFAYQQYQARIQVQATAAEKLQQAQGCFVQSDFACAIEQAQVVLSLQPENPLASQLLENARKGQELQQTRQRIAQLEAEAKTCLNVLDHACAQLKVRELLSLEPNHPQAQQLLEDARRLEVSREIREQVELANECLAQSDLACANRHAERARTLDAQHPLTLELHSRILDLRAELQQAEASRSQQLAQKVAAGEACLKKHDFNCALRQAEAALALDSQHPPAVALQESARQGQQQATRVKAILEEARVCMDQQKNYSCAIAKAEAALNLIPNHEEAKLIRDNALEIQQRLKETGFTIR